MGLPDKALGKGKTSALQRVLDEVQLTKVETR